METVVGPLPPGVTWLQRLPAKGNAGPRVSYRLGTAVELPYKPQRSHLGTCFAIAPTVWVIVVSPPSPTCTPSHWLNLQSCLQLGFSRAIFDWLNQADSHSGQTGS